MTVEIRVASSLGEVDRRAYDALHASSDLPAFYDWRFLQATEDHPLLPTEKALYLCAYQGGELVAFLPAYLQRLAVIDPLGLLERAAGIVDRGGEVGLFSHMMHCWQTTIPCLPWAQAAQRSLIREFLLLARRERASYAGLLNVAETGTLQSLSDTGLTVYAMPDRYAVDLDAYESFDDFVRRLPADGRHEMNRQLRKFKASNASIRILAPPYDEILERLCSLCHATTSRRGTPHYFPSGPLARFVRRCADLSRLIVVEEEGKLLGGMICYQHNDVFYGWSAGVVYDQSDFSPYTLFFGAAFRYAIERGLRRMEGGRLNEKIKRRLGLQPFPLHAAVACLRGASDPIRVVSSGRSHEGQAEWARVEESA